MTFLNRARAADRMDRLEPHRRVAADHPSDRPMVPRDAPRHAVPEAPMSHRRAENCSEAPNAIAVVSGTSGHVVLGARTTRIAEALRRQENWVQLLKFGVVGASGYVVNLAVYTLLLNRANLHYIAAATGSFLLAASWNYWWNRTWTFRAQRGHFGIQGMRFFIVSAAMYGANVAALAALVSAGLGKIVAQAVAIILVTPLNYLGNKVWSFRH